MANSKSNSGANRIIDWPAIKLDYLKGLSHRALALRHDVPRRTIDRRIQRERWSRDEARDLPAFEIAALRVLAAKLRDRLELYMDTEPARSGTVTGARESPAALLLKLCQITEKIITMESRIGGANGPPSARLSEQDHEILKRFKSRHGLSG